MKDLIKGQYNWHKIINSNFEELQKEVEVGNDNLSIAMGDGYRTLDTKIDTKFAEANNRITTVKSELTNKISTDITVAVSNVVKDAVVFDRAHGIGSATSVDLTFSTLFNYDRIEYIKIYRTSEKSWNYFFPSVYAVGGLAYFIRNYVYGTGLNLNVCADYLQLNGKKITAIQVVDGTNVSGSLKSYDFSDIGQVIVRHFW